MSACELARDVPRAGHDPSWPARLFFASDNMKRTLRYLLVSGMLAGAALGCGGDVTPNVNKGKDRPVPAEPQPADKK